MGMLEQMMQGVIDKTVAENFPHLKLPAVMYAIVTRAGELADTYAIKGLLITNEDKGETYKAHMEGKWWEYSLQVLTRFGDADETYPEIPGVRSKLQIPVGNLVAVGFSHGELTPAIIGEVVL